MGQIEGCLWAMSLLACNENRSGDCMKSHERMNAGKFGFVWLRQNDSVEKALTEQIRRCSLRPCRWLHQAKLSLGPVR
jgi:hypothetical protein